MSDAESVQAPQTPSGPSAVWRRLHTGVLGVDSALLRVRNSMTPGQRWTAALALMLTIAVVGFGMPSGRALLPGFITGGTTSATQPVGPPAPGAPQPPVAGPLTAQPPGAVPVTTAVAHTSDDVPAATPPAAAGVPTVVALTEPAPTVSSPHNDDAMARAALATAVFPWHDIADAGNATTLCARVAAAGRVVLAAHALSLAFEQCLLTNGLVVLSPSPRGTRRLASGPRPGAGLSLGIRRGDLASLGDLAQWAHATHAAAGRVGLVLDAARRSDLVSAAAAVRRHGLDVVTSAWLDDSSSMTDVLAAVNQFAAAHVRSVVFAVPVSVQQHWVAEAKARLADFSYVVSDVDDGVVDERYPPTFDGALAHTSLRVPWYTRDNAATADEQYCAAQWTAAATPPLELPAEQAPVDEWCEGVALLNHAITEAVLSGGNLASALLTLRMSSPLTSTVGPLSDSMWGPTADAVLTWRTRCNCWQETTGFRPRS
ncbi:MAG: hypothetical protein ACJ735_05430 [Actinomycetes bacterium]